MRKCKYFCGDNMCACSRSVNHTRYVTDADCKDCNCHEPLPTYAEELEQIRNMERAIKTAKHALLQRHGWELRVDTVGVFTVHRWHKTIDNRDIMLNDEDALTMQYELSARPACFGVSEEHDGVCNEIGCEWLKDCAKAINFGGKNAEDTASSDNV